MTKMKILWIGFFSLLVVKLEWLEAKKLSTKRSTTLIQRRGYSHSSKSETSNLSMELSEYDHTNKLPENLKMRAAEELLYMFGLKVCYLFNN